VNNTEDLRKQRNKDIVRRMRRGDSLLLVTKEQTFYPPRPNIEKDKTLSVKNKPKKPTLIKIID